MSVRRGTQNKRRENRSQKRAHFVERRQLGRQDGVRVVFLACINEYPFERSNGGVTGLYTRTGGGGI